MKDINTVSDYNIKKHFSELKKGNLLNPMKMKDKPKLEQLNILEVNLFGLLPIIDFLILHKKIMKKNKVIQIYINHHCLIANSHSW